MSALVIGVPTEIKDNENRVSMQPDGVAELVHHGHQVVVQAGAGKGSRFADAEFAAAGAKIVATADEVFAARGPDREGQGADPGGVPPLPRGPAAVHLPASGRRPRADRVPGRPTHRLDRLRDGADRRRQAAAAHADERGRRADGGAGGRAPPGEPGRRERGSCSAACPVRPRPRCIIIGGGVSGTEAAKIALGMRAMVRVLDTNPARLAYLSDIFGGRLDLVTPNRTRTAAYVAESDVVIGAVLVPGAKAPKLVTREMIAGDASGQRGRGHRHRPGRVLRDQPPDHPFRPHLRRGGGGPLLRGEHPGSGGAHVDARVDVVDVALPGHRCGPRRHSARPRPIRPWPAG